MRAYDLLAPLLILALAGCASSRSYRDLSSRTGVVVETLNVGTAEFIAHQNALNSENAARLDRLADYTRDAEVEAARQQYAWSERGDARALDLYSRVTTPDAEDIVAAMNRRTPRAPAIEDGGAGKAYAKTKEALAKLAAKPTALQLLAGLLANLDAIRAANDQLREEAEDDGTETVMSASAKDAAAKVQ